MEKRQPTRGQQTDLFTANTPSPVPTAAQRTRLLPLIEALLTEATLAAPANRREGGDDQDHA